MSCLVKEETLLIIDGSALLEWAQVEFGEHVSMDTDSVRTMQGESCWCAWSVQIDEYTRSDHDPLAVLIDQAERHGVLDVTVLCEYLWLIGRLDAGVYTIYWEW